MNTQPILDTFAHATASLQRAVPLVTVEVADVSDAERWPEIARALDHARKLRETDHG